MKFTGSIEINKPQSTVAELFADPINLKEFQDGFLQKELISGKMGEAGAVSRLTYKYGNTVMELMETITKNSLPESFEAFYHHKHMDNTMKCRFIQLDEKKTRYEYEYEYIRINWLMPRLMAIFYPAMYRKQGEKWIRQFKEFVENQE